MHLLDSVPDTKLSSLEACCVCCGACVVPCACTVPCAIAGDYQRGYPCESHTMEVQSKMSGLENDVGGRCVCDDLKPASLGTTEGDQILQAGIRDGIGYGNTNGVCWLL